MKNWFVVVGALGMSASFASAGTVIALSELETAPIESESLAAAELAVEVLNVSDGMVDFRFTNTGPDEAVITNVYFNDAFGMYADLASVDDDRDGVEFGQGGEGVPEGVDFSPLFSLESNGVEGGVGGGEWLSVRFQLSSGASVEDLIGAFGSGQSIGARVEDAGSGHEEFFRTRVDSLGNMPLVPLPSAAWLGLSGLGVTVARRRR